MSAIILEPGEIMEGFLDNKHKMEAIIDDNFVDTLINEFNISEIKRDEIAYIIRLNSWIYYHYKQTQDTPPHRQSRFLALKELRKVVKLADALRSALGSLSPIAQDFLAQAQDQADFEASMTETDRSSFGHTIVRRPAGLDATSITLLKQHQIAEAVEIIGNMARHGVERIERIRAARKGGRPRNHALHLWAYNMRMLWEKMLGRPFRLDVKGGEMLTPAALFCWEVVSKMDTTVTSTELATVMRAEIQSLKRGRGRRPQR